VGYDAVFENSTTHKTVVPERNIRIRAIVVRDFSFFSIISANVINIYISFYLLRLLYIYVYIIKRREKRVVENSSKGGV